MVYATQIVTAGPDMDNGWVGGVDGVERAFGEGRSPAILSAGAGEICCFLAALYVADESIWLQLRRR
jgi:hypothetical protein